MPLLRVGDVIENDSTLDPNETERALAIILNTDGSRIPVSVMAFPVNEFIELVLERTPNGNPPVFWGYLGPFIINPSTNSVEGSFRVIPSYLPYTPDDRVAVPAVHVPVNQIPDIRAWRDRLAIFAHHLDLAHGSYTVDVELGESDRAALFQYGKMLIGNALNEMDEWAKIDPQHKFVRNNETILSWKDRGAARRKRSDGDGQGSLVGAFDGRARRLAAIRRVIGARSLTGRESERRPLGAGRGHWTGADAAAFRQSSGAADSRRTGYRHRFLVDRDSRTLARGAQTTTTRSSGHGGR